MILVAIDWTLTAPRSNGRVVLATPLRNGVHIGFIVNKADRREAAAAVPRRPAVHGVEDSAYLGGLALVSPCFAVTRMAPKSATASFHRCQACLRWWRERTPSMHHRETPNEARYFIGMMVWKPGALEEQVGANVWEVRPGVRQHGPTRNSRDAWHSLRGPWADLELIGCPYQARRATRPGHYRSGVCPKRIVHGAE